jgi:hypothetical protein
VQAAFEFARIGSLQDGNRTGTIVVSIGVYALTLVVGARAVWLARRGRFVGIGVFTQLAVPTLVYVLGFHRGHLRCRLPGAQRAQLDRVRRLDGRRRGR